MTEFVAYFSTAQEQLGYVVLDGHGTSTSDFVGGPPLASGIYRLEGDELVLVEATSD